MKKNFKLVVISLSAFVVGSFMNNFALSDVVSNYKIAVIDVQKVVSNSVQVNALKEEQKKKVQDLTSFVEKAKADVLAEKDTVKQKDLEDKYNKELNIKKSTMDKEYAQKLSEIDKSISTVISAKAKKDNYALVLSKGVVLFGGDDITESVAKAVK